MSDDKLIEELRARLWFASGELAAHGGFDNHCRALDEAADALAAKDTALSEMRVELERLREALRSIAEFKPAASRYDDPYMQIAVFVRRAAHTAIADGDRSLSGEEKL